MIPTPKEAWDLLNEYNKGEFHLKHGRIVGDVMRWYAEKLGYGEQADFWESSMTWTLNSTRNSIVPKARRLCGNME